MKWEIGSTTIEFDEHRWYIGITAYSGTTQVEHLVIGKSDCGEPAIYESVDEWAERSC